MHEHKNNSTTTMQNSLENKVLNSNENLIAYCDKKIAELGIVGGYYSRLKEILQK